MGANYLSFGIPAPAAIVACDKHRFPRVTTAPGAADVVGYSAAEYGSQGSDEKTKTRCRQRTIINDAQASLSREN